MGMQIHDDRVFEMEAELREFMIKLFDKYNVGFAFIEGISYQTLVKGYDIIGWANEKDERDLS